MTYRGLVAILTCVAALGGCAPLTAGAARRDGGSAPASTAAPASRTPGDFGSSAPHDFGSRGP